jgi:hypothetical protein
LRNFHLEEIEQMSSIFTKKVSAASPKPRPEQLTATEKMRCLLQARARRRSMLAIATDINDAAGEKSNRELARNIAANMAGPTASPETVSVLAKTTYNTLPVSTVKIISESALQGFADGSDLLSDEAKIALCEYLHGGFTTIDLETDRLQPTAANEPKLAGIPPVPYVNPNPEIAAAHKALHDAIARGAAR